MGTHQIYALKSAGTYPLRFFTWALDRCYRAQMLAAVLCQGLAVCGTFPNLLAEFAPVHTQTNLF